MTAPTLAALVVASMTAQDAAPQRRVTRVEPLVIEVGGHIIRAGATVTTSQIATSGARFFVWTDGCTVTVGDREPEKVPVAGWRITPTVRTPLGDTLELDVDWQRLWDRSARVADGPKGTPRAVWRLGDRIELDRIDPAACGATSVLLHITTARPVRTVNAPELFTSGNFATASPIRAAAGAGRGGGSGILRIGGAGLVSAELWLMHTTPDGRETTQMRAVTFRPSGVGFAFTAVAAQSSSGTANVIVTGTISVRNAPNSTQPSALIVTIQRVVSGGEPAVPTTSGGTTKEIPWADTTGVISFELPAATGAGQDLLPGHRFSLRVRLTGR